MTFSCGSGACVPSIDQANKRIHARMMHPSKLLAPLAALSLLLAAPACAETVGEDATTCTSGQGPAIQANLIGLKDRVGEVWMELYPASEADFLRPDTDLMAEGKTFRRTRSRLPSSGAVSICVRLPHPGRYTLMLRHNRVGRDKFSVWSDGAGLPTNQKIGRTKPAYAQALITAGPGVTVANIKMQYLRGLGGFGPIDD